MSEGKIINFKKYKISQKKSANLNNSCYDASNNILLENSDLIKDELKKLSEKLKNSNGGENNGIK